MANPILNTGYEVMITGLAGAYLAQIFKFFLHLIVKKQIDFKQLTTTGGMPSSHSAGVVGFTVAVGIIAGYDSLLFAVSAGYAVVVMYDAAGLRRAAGKTAACMNRMMEDFYKHDVHAAGEKLKELLGHTPVEVLAGGLFGVLFAYFMHYYVWM